MFSPAELWALNTGAGHSVMHEWLDCWLCCQHYLKACSRYTHICTQTHTKLQLCIRWVVFLIYNYDTFTALRLFVRFKLSIQLVKNTAVIGYLGDLVSCGIVWECEEGLMWLLLYNVYMSHCADECSVCLMTWQWGCDDVTAAEFPTTSMEMQAVADKFDRDGDGFIDYKEFITALRPERGEVVLVLCLLTVSIVQWLCLVSL